MNIGVIGAGISGLTFAAESALDLFQVRLTRSISSSRMSATPSELFGFQMPIERSGTGQSYSAICNRASRPLPPSGRTPPDLQTARGPARF